MLRLADEWKLVERVSEESRPIVCERVNATYISVVEQMPYSPASVVHGADLGCSYCCEELVLRSAMGKLLSALTRSVITASETSGWAGPGLAAREGAVDRVLRARRTRWISRATKAGAASVPMFGTCRHAAFNRFIRLTASDCWVAVKRRKY